jgi:hypothetical protein
VSLASENRVLQQRIAELEQLLASERAGRASLVDALAGLDREQREQRIKLEQERIGWQERIGCSVSA